MHDNVDIVSAAFAVREGKVPLGPQPEMDVWRLFLHNNIIKFTQYDIT